MDIDEFGADPNENLALVNLNVTWGLLHLGGGELSECHSSFLRKQRKYWKIPDPLFCFIFLFCIILVTNKQTANQMNKQKQKKTQPPYLL